jgi:uncharacterized protein YndB with AHSA1/START domain
MRSFSALLALFLLSNCATSTPKGSAKQALSRPSAERINWPERYRPAKSSFFVHNEIVIKAPAKVVWDILLEAETWPEWYVGAERVKLLNSKSARLTAESVFTWKTMGMNFESHVKEFLTPSRLAWESQKTVIQGYHAWLLIPTEGGCKVITDESFRGPLGLMQGTFIPNKLHRLHQIFLEELKKKAEATNKL